MKWLSQSRQLNVVGKQIREKPPIVDYEETWDGWTLADSTSPNPNLPVHVCSCALCACFSKHVVLFLGCGQHICICIFREWLKQKHQPKHSWRHLWVLSQETSHISMTVWKWSSVSMVCKCSVLSHFSHVWHYTALWTSLSGSSVHGILQARILEWVAMPSSGGSFRPGIKPMPPTPSALAGRFFTTSATWEAHGLYTHPKT